MLTNGSSQSGDIQKLKEVGIGFSVVSDNINNSIKTMLIIS